MKRSSRPQQGFTLLEVLIALALMALISIISWQALDLVERSSERLNASTDDTLALLRVLGQIESDLKQHAGDGILPRPGQGSSSTAAPDALLPAGIAWNEPVLSVVRSSAQGGAWQQVAWGRDGETLRRAVGPTSYTLPLPATATGDVVLEDVQGFFVRAWVPGQGWTALGSTNSQTTTTGLEVIIQRRHHGASETYRKVVLLP